jgi:cytidine deaminase
MCRQTLAEFCEADFPVHCDEGENDDVAAADVRTHRLGDLLPETITAAHLGVEP